MAVEPGKPAARRRQTPDESAKEIGAALRQKRLREGLTQDELARRSSVSVGTVKGLELGKGSSLRSFIRVSRVLGADGWIDAMVASQEPDVSPMQLLRARQATGRSRRARPRKAGRGLPTG
jgi:transcriptional regulator with XRE-family HTH domain